MANIRLFKPKINATAQANLSAFVKFCRKLSAFNAKNQFDEDAWDVNPQFGRNKKLYFHSVSKEQIIEPLRSVIKGMAAYNYSLTPMKSATTYEDLTYAVRGLDVACHALGSRFEFPDLDGFTFNRAMEYFKQQGLNSSTLYRRGAALARIAEFLQEHQLVKGPLSWRNPIPRPDNLTGRSGHRGDEARAKKLPSQAAIDAIPQIFHLAHSAGSENTFAQTVTSYCALLMSNPARANELLTQPVNILVENFSEANSGLGLRWWPEKDGTPIVKPVLETFEGVVRKAYQSLMNASAQAREIAQWYEKHPRQMYLPKDVRHLRKKEYLTYLDIKDIFYGIEVPADANTDLSVRRWVKRSGIPVTKRRRLESRSSGRHLIRFKDLEASVLAYLPPGMPVHPGSGRRYSEMLFITGGLALRGAYSDIRVLFSPISYTSIQNAIGGGVGSISIFEQYGFKNLDDSPIRMNTHQFRHWLNTLGQLAGMTQLDIALWSGRKNIAQNEVYNHITPEQRLERMRQQIGDRNLATGQLSTLPKVIPIKRADYLAAKIPTAHVTDFGYCIHDFSLEPCQLHRDCLFCNDHACVKGDTVAENRLLAKLEETRRLLDTAREALSEGEYGADRWVQHNTEVVDRLCALRDVLDDPAIANGAIIQLANPEAPSRLKEALESRVKLEQIYPSGVPTSAKENAARIEELKSSSGTEP